MQQVHAKHWRIPILNFSQDKNSTAQSVAIIVLKYFPSCLTRY